MTIGSPEDWRRRGVLFNTAADDYRDGRPGYPDELFDILRDECGLRDGSSVLEVGAGAGQATLALLDAGAQVTAVEPGANFAEILRARTAGRDVTTVMGTLEDVDLADNQFDLVVAATAFHWVDPQVGFPKAARLLRTGGWLALWWTIWGDPNRPDPLQAVLEPVIARKAPHLLPEAVGAASYVLDAEARRAEFTLAGVLGEPHQDLISWTDRHTAEQTRALFGTFSPMLALDAAMREELLDDIANLVNDEFDGLVERPFLTVLHRAQRVE